MSHSWHKMIQIAYKREKQGEILNREFFKKWSYIKMMNFAVIKNLS